MTIRFLNPDAISTTLPQRSPQNRITEASVPFSSVSTRMFTRGGSLTIRWAVEIYRTLPSNGEAVDLSRLGLIRKGSSLRDDVAVRWHNIYCTAVTRGSSDHRHNSHRLADRSQRRRPDGHGLQPYQPRGWHLLDVSDVPSPERGQDERHYYVRLHTGQCANKRALRGWRRCRTGKPAC